MNLVMGHPWLWWMKKLHQQ
uniref:Uncharacterized protein n=1 Tax=Arundo donax TaxID=35708 RepID=A0A0A9BID3_ARUDO